MKQTKKDLNKLATVLLAACCIWNYYSMFRYSLFSYQYSMLSKMPAEFIMQLISRITPGILAIYAFKNKSCGKLVNLMSFTTIFSYNYFLLSRFFSGYIFVRVIDVIYDAALIIGYIFYKKSTEGTVLDTRDTQSEAAKKALQIESQLNLYEEQKDAGFISADEYSQIIANIEKNKLWDNV